VTQILSFTLALLLLLGFKGVLISH